METTFLGELYTPFAGIPAAVLSAALAGVRRRRDPLPRTSAGGTTRAGGVAGVAGATEAAGSFRPRRR
ncbi:hypothetical protein [Streptomyces sp. NPDC005423]|uniref:hypothetical protein n=1 Tax=Streptomyces sp. NPDC005423 TaxID=3155343 RepID=UPI00339F5C99